MKNTILKMVMMITFLMFGALSSAQAEMKCAPGKCGGQMQEAPKPKADSNMGQKCPSNVKCDMNASSTNNAKCDMKAKGKCNCDMKNCKCKDGKCDMKNCKCKDGKCDPKMKQKCAVDGKCPVNAPVKK
jgi:hypothetical protein